MGFRDFCRINFLAALFGLLVGCTDVNPAVSILRSFEEFDFSSANIVTSSLSSVPLQAQCSTFLGSIEMSLDGGSSWIAPTSYDSSAASSCESGSFSVTLSSSKAPWSTMSFVSGQVIEVQFRVQPRMGDWIYRTVTITYTPTSPISQEILSGAQTQTGTGMVLKGRLRAQQQHVASGGSFIVKGRISQ